MTEKIELESLYTPYTLDTYSAFTMESDEERIIEDLKNYDQETGKERETPLELTYDDIEWDFDCKGYVKALAENWLDIMRDNILDEVITGIDSDCIVHSPQYYNFTTDKIFATFTVDTEKLREYIKNCPDFEAEKLKDRDGFMWFGDESQTMLSFYLHNESTKKLSNEAYMLEQFDAVSGM